MPRTTPELVAGIIEADVDIPLDPFIEAATMLIDRVVAVVKDDDGSDYYNSTQLEVIERWLAAHFYAVRDPRPVFEGVGKVQVSNESKVDLNLNNTRYGEQAMLLDSSGALARLNAEMLKGFRSKPLVIWLGRTREERSGITD